MPNYIMMRSNDLGFNLNYMIFMLTKNVKALFNDKTKDKITIFHQGDETIEELGVELGVKTEESTLKELKTMMQDGDASRLIAFWEGRNWEYMATVDDFPHKEILCRRVEEMLLLADETDTNTQEFFIAWRYRAWKKLQAHSANGKRFKAQELLEKASKDTLNADTIQVAIEQNSFDDKLLNPRADNDLLYDEVEEDEEIAKINMSHLRQTARLYESMASCVDEFNVKQDAYEAKIKKSNKSSVSKKKKKKTPSKS